MSAWKRSAAGWLVLLAFWSAPAAAEPSVSPPEPEPYSVAVELREFGTRPASIALPADRPVRITVTNTGRLTHSLHIEGLEIGTDFVQPGGIEVLEFVPRRAGTWRMTCDIEGHARVGRAGRVVVSGDAGGVPAHELAADGDTERPPAPAAP